MKSAKPSKAAAEAQHALELMRAKIDGGLAPQTLGELQQFVGRRLADCKVPARILFMPEIPKGATGKLQRARSRASVHYGVVPAVSSASVSSTRFNSAMRSP